MQQHSPYAFRSDTGQVWGRWLRAGSQALPIVRFTEGTQISTVPWKEVVTWQGDARLPPVPVVLTVEATGYPPLGGQEGAADVPGYTIVRASPGFWNQNSPRMGMLLLRYGVHGVMRERWIDPRSGTYQLPPCHYASVVARAYGPGSGAAPEWDLGVSLAPGRCEPSTVATYSGVRAYAGGGETYVFQAVPGTYGYRVALLTSVGSDIAIQTIGAQPDVLIGPLPDYVPAIADLAATNVALSFEITGADGGFLTVEALVGL